MKDRILKFITVENINASKFADEIGVQRSSISHILSGRNNPSLELIQKILARFPYINAEWLITGKGEMFKPERQPTIFDQLIQNENNLPTKQEDYLEPKDLEKTENLEKTVKVDEIKHTTKKIEKILLLYNDGTASIYEINK
jgi:transcriptional regulator with XRE-family HTH domain